MVINGRYEQRRDGTFFSRSLQVIFLNDFYLSQLLEGNPRQSGGNGMTLVG